MASTSDAAATAINQSIHFALPLKKYDVFISFRGEDTRDNFTSHLHAALLQHQLETFIDYRLQKGDDVWPSLVQAIQDSTVSLVIFSQNYASSTWCLNELIEIMEQHNKKKGHVVVPVFFKIDPSHVRKQTHSYQTAFTKHEQDIKISCNMIHKWKETLFQAANLSGFDSRVYRTENDLIEGIIKLVLLKLNHKHSTELRGHFILDENYKKIKSLLKIESRDVRIIGMWGMGGIGKTSIAEAVFQEVSSQYEGSCFLANAREQLKRHGLNHVCSRLLSKLLEENLHIDTPKVLPSFVMTRLRRKKVFIVLDDVNSSELIENFARIVGQDWLGAGSRVIVTTRNKHVLVSGGVDDDDIHEVKKMSFQDSLKLFSYNAFNKTHPKKGYKELSGRAVVYAKGNPLALKVLGSFLRSKSEGEWQSALMKLKKFPNEEIQNVLRLSYDELDDTEKNIFLDIACFFKGYIRDEVSRVLNACGFFADIGIRNLLDKALITIDVDECIEMHDLIQDMGHEIIRCESINNPGRRSRLWDSGEVYDVLTSDKGTDAVESIFLDMTQINDLHLHSYAFKNMRNLRLLAFYNTTDFRIKKSNNSVCIPADFQLPSNLVYFRWDDYPLKFLPSTSCWEKLVDLSLVNSNVNKLWNGKQNFPSLKKINLENSKHLIECPNLLGAPNLEVISLAGCESLGHVHPSIFSLQKLEKLSVMECKALESLCSKGCSPSLRMLAAFGCTNLRELSITMPADHCITVLDLGNSTLNKVPSSILHLQNLKCFLFPICESLRDLPANFVTDSIWLTDSMKPGVHDALITCLTLRTILPSPVFRNISHLIITCSKLSQLPDNIRLLSSLKSLTIRGCNLIISLPESIKYLPRLVLIDVRRNQMLHYVPALPQCIRFFYACDCVSLKTLLSSKTVPSIKNPCFFLLHNCINLDQDAYDAVLKDVITRIEYRANSLSAVTLENKNDVCYFLPATRGKVRECFHYSSTQASVTVKLPPIFKCLGFVFYFIVPPVQSCFLNLQASFGCECFLEKSSGEMIEVTSFFVDKDLPKSCRGSFEIKLISDHLLLWYDAQCCKGIMKTIKEIKAVNDGSTTDYLTFKFFAHTEDNEELVIKECGVRWIYPSEDQIVEEGRGSKCKRGRDIYELHNGNIVRNGDTSESNDPDEMIPPSKKLKQCVFGTPSNLDRKEVEDLRLLLELHLHIGEDLK